MLEYNTSGVMFLARSRMLITARGGVTYGDQVP